MKQQIMVVAAAVAVAGLAACSSSSSSTASGNVTSRPAVTHSATVAGTERFYGTVTGSAVVANNAPTYPLTFTGPVATTGTFTPPNNNNTHQTGMFKTAAGNMAVTATVTGLNQQPIQAGHCLFKIPIRATYVVNGAASTGKFAGAVGHGTVTANTQFYVKTLKNGTCDMNQKDQPLTKGAISVFNASGPLTIKQ